MSTREIILDGGSPWGFRMHGGADVGQPLRISRVNPGSKAAQKGIREGDVISSINGQSTRNITNSDAHALLRNAGQTLHLGLNEECSGSPKRRLHRNVQDSKSEAIKRTTVTRTTTTTSRNSTVSVNGATDPNCNNKISTKDDGRQGKQNGSLKENTITSSPDSKGARRRRRQQNSSLQITSNDVKEDSDTIPEKSSIVPSEAGTGRTRRRRRSRGGNRRKCRTVGVESESGSEQKTVSQDEKEVSLTERETDSALSDFGSKNEDKTSTVIEESFQVSSSKEVIVETKSEVVGKVIKEKIKESCKSESGADNSKTEIVKKINELDVEKQRDINKISETTLTQNKVQLEVLADSNSADRGTDVKRGRRRRFLEDRHCKTESVKEVKCEVTTEIPKETKSENRKIFDKGKEINSLVFDGKLELTSENESKIDNKSEIAKESKEEVRDNKTETEVTMKSENEDRNMERIECINSRKEIESKIKDSEVETGKGVPLQDIDNKTVMENKIKLQLSNAETYSENQKKHDEAENISENKEIVEKQKETMLKNDNLNGSTLLQAKEVGIKIDAITESTSNFVEVKSGTRTEPNSRETFTDILIPETVIEINNEKAKINESKKNYSDNPTEEPGPKVEIQTAHSVTENKSLDLGGGYEVLNKHSIEIDKNASTAQSSEIIENLIPVNEMMNEHSASDKSQENNIVNNEKHESEIVTNCDNYIEKIRSSSESENADSSDKAIDISIAESEESMNTKGYSGVKVISVVSVESSCDKDIESTSVLTSDRKKPLKEVVVESKEFEDENKVRATDALKENAMGNDDAETITETSLLHNVKPDVSEINFIQNKNDSVNIVSISNNIEVTLQINKGEIIGGTRKETEKQLQVEKLIPVSKGCKISDVDIQKEEIEQFSENSNKLEGGKELLDVRNSSKEEQKHEVQYVENIKDPSETMAENESTERKISNSNSNNGKIVSSIKTDECTTISSSSRKESVTKQILECKAIVVEAEPEELWEQVEELGENEIFYDANDGLSEDIESSFLVSSNTTALQHDSSKLSKEDKELLDPRPLIEAEEEETLRKFLHSLNLADYSKEAVNARNAELQDPSGKSVEEMYATRKDKRRNIVEACPPSYNQQRGLEVILEENSSDYSDGEKRGEETRASEIDPRVIRRNKAWEEAVYIPETNEVVYLTRESDEGDQESTGSEQGSSRNSGVFYSETTVTSDPQGNAEGRSYVYRRTSNESRRTRIISEEVSIDVFSEDMENALENALGCEEVESEGSRRDEGEDSDVKIELADTSDEEDRIEGTWKRGKARERLNGVEIVYLDEDSGSTSSGVKNEEDGVEDGVREEDPDFMYESDEFPVIGNIDAEYLLNKESSGGSSESIYENVEFINQKMTFLKNKEGINIKKEINIPAGNKESVVRSNETSAIYENIVFKRQNESETRLNTKEVSSISTLQEDNRNNMSHLPGNCIESVGKGSKLGGEINLSNTALEEQNNESKEKANYKTITDSNTQLEPDVVDINENKPTQHNTLDFSNTRKADVTVGSQNTERTTVEPKNTQLPILSSSKATISRNNEMNFLESCVNLDNTPVTADTKTVLSVIVQEEKLDNNVHLERPDMKRTSEENSLLKDKEISDNILSIEAIENDAKGIKLCNNNDTVSSEFRELKQIKKDTLEINDSDSDYKTPCNITPEPFTLKNNDNTAKGIRDAGRNDEEIFEELDSITPTNRSRHGSSSSDAGSHGTAFYCPSGFSPVSSDADISSFTEDFENRTLRRRYSPLHSRVTMPRSRSQENISDSKKSTALTKLPLLQKSVVTAPKSLKEISVEKVLSMPYGNDILRILGIAAAKNCDKQTIVTDVKDTVRRLHFLNFPPFSAAYRYMGKPPLSGSLPDLSNVKLEKTTRGGGDHEQITQLSSSAVMLPSSPQPVQPPQSLAGSQWLGMPTKEDPNLYICLSPSQVQSYHDGIDPTPEEADNLLDLHRKFIHRRSYHEAGPPPPPDRKFFGIRHYHNSIKVSNDQSNFQQSPSTQVEKDQNIKQSVTSANIIPSPRFRAVVTSLDSKIHCEGNTGEVLGGPKEKRDEDVAEKGASTPVGEGSGFSRSRSSSRLLAIIRAASSDPSNNVEFQPPSSSSSSAANSPPPLPPLPHAYQNQLEMLNFIHQGKRPSTICCTTYDDFDYVLQDGAPKSPSSYNQKSNNINLYSPSSKLRNGESVGDTTPSWSNKNGESRKERTQSWYGQELHVKLDRERLRVKYLSDWLQLVRCGGSKKDDDGTRSVDSTPPRSACLSTQSSPGPIRRTKDPSPKPEARNNTTKEQNYPKEYQTLKQQIIERRFSLPEKQTEEMCKSNVEIIRAPTSPREDERHDQQLRLLHQRQQQRLRSQQVTLKAQQQLQEKTPPLPQPPKHNQPSIPPSEVKELRSHQGENIIQRSQNQKLEEVLNSFQEEAKSQESQSQSFRDIINSLHEETSEKTKKQSTQEISNNEAQHKYYRKSNYEEWLQNERKFDAEVYKISKKGDIAIIHNNSTTRTSNSSKVIEEEKVSKEVTIQQIKSTNRPKSMPAPTESLVTGGEFFRQQMYNEYMNKVAERAQRRRQKVIRLSSVPRDDAVGKQSDASESAASALQLENEFMGRVRERMDKLGLKYDEESDDGANLKGAGGGGEDAELPKHLKEFLVITGGAETDTEVNTDRDGVWSPSQKSSIDPSADSNSRDKEQEKRREGDDAHPMVWTPKSAGASPTAERKEFRPVNFESPKLQRKNRSATSTPTPTKPDSFQQSTVTPSSVPESTTTATTTFSSIFPPWQQPLSSLQQQHSRDDSTVSVGSTIQSPTSEKSVASSTISTSIDRRLVQSQSAPASGLSALASSGSSSIKLPRAQNPTITLLQKAREGQLPRGALYLDHKMNSKEGDKPYVSPNETLYSVKKEYESDVEPRKKMVELGPRKFEGIGPTTKEGIPIVLRSEVKDTNQAKWYKRMYESLHRAGKDDDYVTIRYKPRRGHYPYTAPGGYLSEPEPACYDSDIGYSAKYATLDRRRIKNKENDFTTSTLPRSRYVPHPASIKYATEVYKNQPGRIEDYEPGHSSISEKETKQWWDEVLDIFDGWLETHSPHHHHQHHPNYRSSSFMTADAIYQRQAGAEPKTTPSTPSNKPFMTYALKESGYESDSTLVFKRRDENQCQLSPAEQKLAYKTIQKGGEVPLHGLRKPAPERPKEPVYGPVPPRSHSPRERATPESPHRYVESEVTIHYRSPVRSEAKEALSEEELARRQAEAMRRIYQEERRRKYLQELQDMHSRRHTDNFTPSQKSPIPLNRYDDFLDDVGNKGKSRDRTPEPKLVARALYNFVGQTSRELSFRRGDIIFVRRQIDKNWYEGEHNAMIGLFPFNYVEIIPYDGIRTIPKRPSEGQARAKFNFIAQTHLELSLVKGELVVLTRRVDDNWFEGRIGNRKGIFPVSYVEVLSEPGEKPVTPVAPSTKPITLPASHTVLMNGSGIKQSMGQHSYQPSSYFGTNKMTSSYTSSNPYATLPRQSQSLKQPLAPVNQTLHIDTHSEPVPYRALYNYRPQNEDELELCEGDTVYVMEKCDDGWYVGSSQRTGYFGTFPGNYVERI